MVVLDIDDIINVLNNFYDVCELENKVENSYKAFEYKIKDNKIYKYSFVYVKYCDENLNKIIEGDWYREYEIIDSNELVEDYRKIIKLYPKYKGYTVSDYVNRYLCDNYRGECEC